VKIGVRHIKFLLFGVSIFLLLCGSSAIAQGVQWKTVKTDVVTELNSDIKPGVATVDVGIYYPSNFDKAFTDQFSLDDLITEFAKSKEIFAVADVQLNLLWIKTGRIEESFFEIQSNNMSGAIPGGLYSNMYVNSRRHPSVLTPSAQSAFESIIEEHETSDRTVYLVVLQSVFMSFFEKLDERTWELRTITTGGLSFPSYIYQQIPRHMRGVITVNRSDPLRGIVAHELGHKLMNVSHEYKDIDPQHEVRDEGGLMLYGSGTDIPSGIEGRWHKERLHLSPYVYVQSDDGVRRWNPDYLEGGHYYDPIYGDKVVQFGTLEPESIEVK
jgi:hypothetical protein